MWTEEEAEEAARGYLAAGQSGGLVAEKAREKLNTLIDECEGALPRLFVDRVLRTMVNELIWLTEQRGQHDADGDGIVDVIEAPPVPSDR